MGRFFSRAYRTICKPAPAKLLRVGIKHFLVSPGSWHSCYIIISCHRAEITDNHNAFLHFIHPAENNNILLVIIGDKPLKALPRILNLPERELNKLRAEQISMIFQDPMTSLNPYMRVGEQLMEVLMLHKNMSKAEAFEESVRMLDAVKMPEARKRMKMYPHEFSGGMRQRVMIAMALLCRPKLLIADEPTTALDVTVQAQIMTLLNELKREFNTAIIMITHDLGVVAGICDKVLVMYAGRTMEYGNARDVFYQPVHPYSIGLLNAVPRLDAEGETMLTIPGNPPNLLRLPKGCPFQPRCPHAMEICSSAPPLEEFTPGRLRACFKPVEELL